MRKLRYQWSDAEIKIFPELSFNAEVDEDSLLVKTITFQVTEDCSLRCTYCYQGVKRSNSMSFETAKTFIDNLFGNRKNRDYYINEYSTKMLIFEFIGGEPLLEIELIEQICDYIESKFAENQDSIWLLHHVYSLCSNGVAYFNEDVQNFLNRYKSLVSITITIDGCKELHDMCRLFPDGSPSYDIAIKAALAELEKGNDATKITLSPDNIRYAAEGVINMLELGFREIMINPVFEEGWTIEDAAESYKEYKRIADYLFDTGLYDKCYIRLFDETSYCNRLPDEDKNWCGSISAMYAINYTGNIYPCIRFMENSLGDDAEPYVIGNVADGIGSNADEAEKLTALKEVTKTSQSTEECINCLIESGCAWCTAYNYQRFGTVNHRATFICHEHKAAALAAKYFYKICGDREAYDKIHINRAIAEGIVSDEEYDEIMNFGGDE